MPRYQWWIRGGGSKAKGDEGSSFQAGRGRTGPQGLNTPREGHQGLCTVVLGGTKAAVLVRIKLASGGPLPAAAGQPVAARQRRASVPVVTLFLHSIHSTACGKPPFLLRAAQGVNARHAWNGGAVPCPRSPQVQRNVSVLVVTLSATHITMCCACSLHLLAGPAQRVGAGGDAVAGRAGRQPPGVPGAAAGRGGAAGGAGGEGEGVRGSVGLLDRRRRCRWRGRWAGGAVLGY